MDLHLHLAGKTGELIYASGCFPAIRQRWPERRIVLHLHPHYFDCVAGLKFTPDFVATYEAPDATRPLAMQVTDCLRREQRARRQMVITQDGDDTHVLMYGVHQRAAALPTSQRKPFYRLFMEAADAEAFKYERPQWGIRGQCLGNAVVLASGNAHTGGARVIELPPAEWNRLADELRAFGLSPVATGHRDDPKPEMPGWAWLDTDRPTDVLLQLSMARVVLGLNSGMTFAACQVAPGNVTMLDTQMRHEYKFGPMYADGVLDPMRHLQIPWATAAEDMVGTVRRALLR